MSAVMEFYRVTVELIQQLETSFGEREEHITNIELSLNQREALISEMIPPFTPKEVEVGRELVQLNSKLEKILETKKIMIQKDIKNIQTKKESNTKYVNPYHNVSTDGMFYDKRK